MVKLEAMLGARMIEGNRQIGSPVLGSDRTESQEHSLEQGAALIAAFELVGGNVKTSNLKT